LVNLQLVELAIGIVFPIEPCRLFVKWRESVETQGAQFSGTRAQPLIPSHARARHQNGRVVRTTRGCPAQRRMKSYRNMGFGGLNDADASPTCRNMAICGAPSLVRRSCVGSKGTPRRSGCRSYMEGFRKPGITTNAENLGELSGALP